MITGLVILVSIVINLLIKGDNYIGLNGDINFDKLLNDIHTVLASHGIQIEAPISFKEEIVFLQMCR